MTTHIDPPKPQPRPTNPTTGRASARPSRLAASRVATFLLAGGEGRRLLPLTRETPKPGLPFGPEGRIIDFALENCLGSGIDDVAVLTQYRPARLEVYLERRFGARFRDRGGALALVRTGVGPIPPCPGTADAILGGLDALPRDLDTLVVLAADHVYRMDYAAFLDAHAASGAHLTIGAVPVPVAEAGRFGVIEADPAGRVRGFAEKPDAPRPLPGDPGRALASMGIYVFRREALAAAARSLGRAPGIDFGRDVVPAVLGAGARVRVFSHVAPGTRDAGLWFDVGTPDALLAASLALHPSGAVERSASVHPEAAVRRSVLRAGAVVGRGAVVDEAFLLEGAVVGAGARVRRAIVGAGCRIPGGSVVGPPAGAAGQVVVIAEVEAQGSGGLQWMPPPSTSSAHSSWSSTATAGS